MNTGNNSHVIQHNEIRWVTVTIPYIAKIEKKHVHCYKDFF